MEENLKALSLCQHLGLAPLLPTPSILMTILMHKEYFKVFESEAKMADSAHMHLGMARRWIENSGSHQECSFTPRTLID